MDGLHDRTGSIDTPGEWFYETVVEIIQIGIGTKTRKRDCSGAGSGQSHSYIFALMMSAAAQSNLPVSCHCEPAKQSHSVREKPVEISRKLPLGRVIMLDICFNLGEVLHLMFVCARESKIQDVLLLAT